MFQATTAFHKIARLQKRIRVVQGGTSASKTVSILLFLIDWAQSEKPRKLKIDVVSETLPHLKLGALGDFLAIMKDHDYFEEARWNSTDKVYTFEDETVMRFYSADTPAKVRGPRRDVLFINECNNVPFGVFDQMEVRTNIAVFLDFNPVGEFWLHEEVLPHRDDHDFLQLTYLDNEALDPDVRASIESRRHNENWWKVYGLGELGSKEGQIYTGWKQIDNIPSDAFLERYGLDFGFTNHPTALIAIYRWNNALIFDEIMYSKGAHNSLIASRIKSQPREALTIADSAEPKSIAEIRQHEVQIMGADKRNRKHGIEVVQLENVFVTKRSLNVMKEQRNYLWKVTKDGTPLNEPEEGFDHAMDAIRYAVTDFRGKSVALPKPRTGRRTDEIVKSNVRRR